MKIALTPNLDLERDAIKCDGRETAFRLQSEPQHYDANIVRGPQ